MAKIKLTKNELKVQKDSLKMFKRYLPTLMLKKQQLQTEIRTIDAKAKEVRQARVELEKEFDAWIAVFGEQEAFTKDMVTVKNIKKGTGNIAGVTIPIYEGADFSRGDYDLYETPPTTPWPAMEYDITSCSPNVITHYPIARVFVYDNNMSLKTQYPTVGVGKIQYSGNKLIFDFTSKEKVSGYYVDLHFEGKLSY